MKRFLQIIAVIGLIAVIAPPLFYLADSIGKAAMQSWMLVGTVLWFVAAPLAGRSSPRSSET